MAPSRALAQRAATCLLHHSHAASLARTIRPTAASAPRITSTRTTAPAPPRTAFFFSTTALLRNNNNDNNNNNSNTSTTSTTSTPLGTITSGAAGAPNTSTNASTLPPPPHLNPAEQAIFTKLAGALSPSSLEVQDVSGGCGSMYAIAIASARFRGLPVVRQHKLVNEVLRDEIAGWHGVQLKTVAV